MTLQACLQFCHLVFQFVEEHLVVPGLQSLELVDHALDVYFVLLFLEFQVHLELVLLLQLLLLVGAIVSQLVALLHQSIHVDSDSVSGGSGSLSGGVVE